MKRRTLIILLSCIFLIFLLLLTLLTIYLPNLSTAIRYEFTNTFTARQSNTRTIDIQSIEINEEIVVADASISFSKDEIGNVESELNRNGNISIYYPTLPKINTEQLKQDILLALGSEEHYGFILHDLKREVTIEHNQDKVFPPASISKLPSVVMTLYRIDTEPELFMDTLIPIQDNLKHGFTDSLAVLPAGAQVPLSRMIDLAILESNNTAHYHLHAFNGGLVEVNSFMQEKLAVNTFSLDPHEATVGDVAKTMESLYYQSLLSEYSNNYLLNLLQNTAPGLQDAIPAGVGPEAQSANKVGFLYGGREGNTYADAAIVYGKKTDYIFVVLNSRADTFPFGSIPIREASRIVYNALD